jgi:hypothetical protein
MKGMWSIKRGIVEICKKNKDSKYLKLLFFPYNIVFFYSSSNFLFFASRFLHPSLCSHTNEEQKKHRILDVVESRIENIGAHFN